MAEVKRRATARVVAKTKRRKGTMSLSISITMRSSTRVALKSEKAEKAFTLWLKERRVRMLLLSVWDGDSSEMITKYPTVKRKRRRSKSIHRLLKQLDFLARISRSCMVKFQHWMRRTGITQLGALKKEVWRKRRKSPARKSALSK